MSSGADFGQDAEFRKLLERREDVDLTVAALELARDGDPNLDFTPTLEWIAKRAGELSGPLARAKSERDVLVELSRHLAETHGLFGEPAAFKKAESSYLPCVIETGRGIPISLSVLYMSVAKAAHIDLNGVAAPAHFLTSCETTEGILFVDAYTHGRVMSRAECVKFITSLTEVSGARLQSHLAPAKPRTIILRMLNNLKAVHIGQEDWGAAWKVQQRLQALQPSSYQERRDLAVVALKSDRPGQAIKLLEDCLADAPEEEREFLKERIEESKRDLSRWN